MSSHNQILQALQGRLIVSCQASEGEAFRDSCAIARFARAAVDGGAGGIRASGAEDVRAIRDRVQVPIIGIRKALVDDGKVLITPGVDDGRRLVDAGAAVIALDCTERGCRYGALERLRQIRAQTGVPVMADIATQDEALAAVGAGADLVATTMRGYTENTSNVDRFDPSFCADLVSRLPVPVLAEGHIHSPAEAAAALQAGAFAVIVGTAITRPHTITEWFARALRPLPEHVVAIDMGGTSTKFGVVRRDGTLLLADAAPTPFSAGREALLEHLKRIAAATFANARRRGLDPSAIGIATAGWVDARSGRVVYATENLPGWTDTRIAEEIRASCGVPVAVENDANALAVGEHRFGVARGVGCFVCVTLGTGVGGGCYVDGRLNRGAHCFANALGHITLVPNGEPCNCGLRGCLETYANAAALQRYAGGTHASAQQVIDAANRGDVAAVEAVRTLSRHLAQGVASMVQLLDPELIVLAGGLVESNPLLLESFGGDLASLVSVPERRKLRISTSKLGYYSGVLGAAAVALERSGA